MIIARKVIFYGQVQGVNFRRNVASLARSLGVKGWVRNLDDGSVEAHMEGDASSVQNLIERATTELFPASVDRYDEREDAVEGRADFRVIS